MVKRSRSNYFQKGNTYHLLRSNQPGPSSQTGEENGSISTTDNTLSGDRTYNLRQRTTDQDAFKGNRIVSMSKYFLTNANNYEVRIITYGGIVTNIFAPDKNGERADVVLGFDHFNDYKQKHPYFGALIGRYANRIAKAQFTLDGVTYKLAANHKDINGLHGGLKGFDKRVWDSSVEGDKLLLTLESPDGEEGYPGKVSVMVSYQLTSDNKLTINYWAETTKPTVINLTNHSYFNLAGHNSGSIGDHVLQLNANHFTPVDDALVPLGNIEPVDGTVMDLRKPTRLDSRLDKVPGGFGFDHNLCFGNPGGMKHMARLHHPGSGRTMNMYSTEPGVQFYTGCNLGEVKGKSGAIYRKYSALCLEAQHYPNSPNQENFPSTVLRPGEAYMQTTSYEFGVEK